MKSRYTEFTKKVIKNPALLGTIVVTIGAIIGSFFNYLLQFCLGRTLSVPDYGIFNALLSFSVILTVFSGSLSAALIKTVADIKVEGKFDVLTKLFWKLSSAFVLVGFFVFIILMMFSNSILNFFHISETNYVLGFALYMSLTFISMLAPAFLQGLLRFKSYAFWSVLTSIFRLIFSMSLVFLGLRVFGAYIGIGMSLVLSYVVSIFLLKKNFTLFKEISIRKYYKRILLFAGPVIFVNLGMTILNNVDVILVKHYFDPEMAGLYSGVVTLGKIFLFGAGTVSVVMYPQISNSFARKEDVFKKIEPFLLLQLLVLVCGFLVFRLFPVLVTKTMFGEKYLPSVPYLSRFIVFVSFYVISNFFTMFLLAMNKTKIFVFHVVAAFVQFTLIRIFHGNINQVIDMNILASTFLSTSLLIYSSYLFYSNKKINSRSR